MINLISTSKILITSDLYETIDPSELLHSKAIISLDQPNPLSPLYTHPL